MHKVTDFKTMAVLFKATITDVELVRRALCFGGICSCAVNFCLRLCHWLALNAFKASQ